MQRYFIQEPYWQSKTVRICDDYHHIVNVVRLKIGDMIACVHPNGKIAACTITIIDEQNDEIIATIENWLDETTELPVDVTIVQSLPKGQKLDLIIQKGTELGATRFILFTSARSVVKWDEQKINKRLTRYKKIAKEASEQSERQIIPEIKYVTDIHAYMQTIEREQYVKLLAYERETESNARSSLYTQLKAIKRNESIIICVGPEGGFTDEEVASFVAVNFTPIRLGKRILRTETASLYALAAISYHVEEMDRHE